MLKNYSIISFCILLSLFESFVNAQTINFDKVTTTYAGTGTYGYFDGPSSSAQFFDPMGLAIDASGNIYVADDINKSIIRKITTTGTVSTVVGTGVQGFQNGPIASANFALPTDVVFSSTGIMYVADNGNHQIRKVSSGNVTTFAGSTTYGFLDGSGTSAKFNQPYSMVFDASGNMYVTDEFNHAIRKITPAGFVTTLAGNGISGYSDGMGSDAQFDMPMGIAIDGSGNLIVADYRNNCIRKVSPTGLVSTIAGSGIAGFKDGSAGVAQFYRPRGVAVDANGYIYVADSYNYRIRKISPSGEVSTIAGNSSNVAVDGMGTLASYGGPNDVVLDAVGNIYVSDGDANLIRKISSIKITAFNTVEGQASAPQGFGISGSVLTDNLIVNAPSGFEISLSQFSGYTSSITLTPVSGNVSTTQIYVRQSATAVSGTYNDNITINSTGAATQLLAVNGIVNANTASPTILEGLQITTVAGTGTAGYLDGPALSAQFKNMMDLAMDNMGNTYIADYSNNRIRKMAPDGTVTTFAGSGTAGYADGVGTSAQFYNPYGIATDQAGNVYVADFNNHRIRKITPDGTVSTLAGSGVSGYANGVGTAAKFYNPMRVAVDVYGNVFVIDYANNIIRKITSDGTVSDFGGSGYNYPSGISTDINGNVYVADQSNHKIKKITPAGVVTTVAGVGTSGAVDGVGSIAKFNYPSDVAVDLIGNIYVSDQNNNVVRKITSTGMVLTIGSGSSAFADGSSMDAYFGNITGVTIDNTGNILVISNERIRKISAPYSLKSFSSVSGSPSYTQSYPIIAAGLTSNLIITAPAGFEISTSSSYSSSLSITPTNGIVRTNIIIRISATAPAGIINDFITVTSANANTLQIPVTGEVDPNNSVVYFDRIVSVKAGNGTSGYLDGSATSAQFKNLNGFAIDANNTMYVADGANNCIRKIASDGTVSTFAGGTTSGFVNGTGTSAKFNNPYALALDASGNLFVADYYNHCVRKITPVGVVTTLAGSGASGFTDGTYTSAQFNRPQGIAIDKSGNVYVADGGNNRIRKITQAGVVTTVAGNGVAYFKDGPALNNNLKSPFGIAFDKNGNLFIADNGNHAIRKLDPNGFLSTVAGTPISGSTDGGTSNASFYLPSGIAIDTNGLIYIGDSGNNKIRQISPNGFVSTIAGSGVSGYLDGLGNVAKFNFPSSVTIDNSGDLFIGDLNNNRIRKVAQSHLTFITNSGTASAAQSLSVSGVHLVGNLTVTAPAGYEVSLSAGSGYASSVSFTPSSGSVVNNVFYIRLSASAAPGYYNGNIRLSSTNALSSELAVIGTVNAVTKSNQTITFNALATKAYKDPSFNLSATSTSGLDVTYISSNPAVATISGTTVNIVGVGTTTITASQSGNFNYNPAADVTQMLTINKADQTISFAVLPQKNVGNSPFNPGATSTSSLTITYTTSDPNVAIVSGTSITIVGAGTATITATQSGNVYFNAASAVSQDLTVNKGNQTITFNTLPVKTYGNAPFSLTAISNSGLPITYTSSDPTVATITGSMVTIVGAGTANITASQSGNSNYNPATDVTRVLTVNAASQTITFNTLPTKNYGEIDFALTATSTSGLPVAFTSSNPAVAIVSGNTVSIVGAGTTNIVASQSGNTNYSAATSVSRLLTVNKANQTITFNPISNRLVGAADFNLDAIASSGLNVTYTSSDPTVATVSGNTIAIIGVGTTNITASQVGNGNYNSAVNIVRSLTVIKASQTITFNSLSNKFVGDVDFNLEASSSSGLTITYTSSNPSVATVNGDVVTIIGMGTTTITASQLGDANYNAASDVSQSLTVLKKDQTVLFNAVDVKTIGDADFDLTATSSSGLVVTYTSSNPAVATVSGNTITIVGPGSTIITASQSGNDTYNAAADVVQILTVNKKSQEITFNAVTEKTIGDADFILDATSSSGLSISYISSNPSVATISGNKVTIVGSGSTSITASQQGDDTYNSASDVVQTLKINKLRQTITFGTLEEKNNNDSDFILNAIASSGLPVTYTSSDPSVAIVSGNIVTIVGVGSTNIIASQSGNNSYDAASDVIQVLNVKLAEGTLQKNVNESKSYPNPTSNIVNIETSYAIYGDVNITIIDCIGNVKDSYMVNGGQTKYLIDVSSFAPGAYLIKLTNDTDQVISRVVKK